MALARFRWVERWGAEKLAMHFGVGTTAIKCGLAKIRSKPNIAGLSLSPPNIRGSKFPLDKESLIRDNGS